MLGCRLAARQHGGGKKRHGPTATDRELLAATVGIARLFQDPAVAVRDLIGSQHPGIRVCCRAGAGLRERKPQGPRWRCLAREQCLGDARRLHAEGQSEALQECRAIG
mgnify:CR=1 FL=1